MSESNNDKVSEQTAQEEKEYFHVDIKTTDGKTQSSYDLSFENVVRNVAVPYRLNMSFMVDGFDVNPAYVSRFKIRRSDEPVNQMSALANMDTSSFSGAISSILGVGARLQMGEDLTADILLIADDIIQKQGLEPLPRSRVFRPVDEKMVFIVTSFSSQLNKNYDAIRRASESFSLTATRVDKKISSESIPDRIIGHLLECNYVIADLTEARPNVYYEIGYFDGILEARGASSEDHLLLVAQDIASDAHFDLKHRGIQTYKDPFGLMEIVENWFTQHGLKKS